MKSKFKVGQRVTAVALPNGIPEPRPEITGLIVTDIRLMDEWEPFYYRLTVVDPSGWMTVEGAESFFEAEPTTTPNPHRAHKLAFCRFCDKMYCADCEPLLHVTCNMAVEE